MRHAKTVAVLYVLSAATAGAGETAVDGPKQTTSNRFFLARKP